MLTNKNRIMRALAVTIIFVVTTARLMAQDAYSFSTGNLNNALVNNSFLANPSLALPVDSALNEQVYGYIKLQTKAEQAPYTNYTLTLQLEVYPIELNGTVSNSPYQVQLKVSNKPNGSQAGYADVAQHIKANKYGFQVKVLQNTLESGGSTVTNASIPANVSFTIGYDTKSYLELTNETVNPVTSVVNNELSIQWNSIPSAESYQLEWTWVDRYGANLTTPKSANEIALTTYEFEHNNTRVEVENTKYRIPLVYQEGFLVYRIRTVGKFLADLSKIKVGPWTSDVVAGNLYVDKEIIADWPHVFTIDAAHEDKKNWEFQVSYAEEGKKKEVVSYFDGSLRNRQTVTTVNSDLNAVVGEVIYDAQGRPAVEVLPVPVNSKILRYYNGFNQNNEEKDYSYLDFDLDEQNQTDQLSYDKQMHDTSGASEYYSPNNTVASPFRDRVPHAQAFPFTQVEYTPDNTGRISRKGGVGINHQLGSEHDMEYYYGVPEQKELNRLFGYSVGNATHYKKNMVLDPNRQLSVSYLDPQGRTIATALAGYAPQHLEGLDDEDNESGLHGSIRTDLLGKVTVHDTDTPTDNNERGISGNFGPQSDQLNYAASKTVVFNEQRDFSYSIKHDQPFFQYDCVTDNSYPFVYNLAIDLVDGENVPITAPLRDVISTANMPWTTPAITAAVERGTFFVSKKLQVNEETLNGYADHYLTRLMDVNDVCYVDPTTVVPTLETTDCFSTAEDCINGLGTQQEYVANRMAAYTAEELGVMSETELSQLTASFIAQYQDAVQLCNSVNADGAISESPQTSISCAASRTNLLRDVIPLGQYALSGEDELSLLNENNVLYSTRIGSTGLHNSWRNPKHEVFDNTELSTIELYTEGHYYNVDGTISYVQVQKVSDDLYAPEVVESALSILQSVNPLDTIHFLVEPQYLKHVNDFVNEWQESWSYSLLSYHPEYSYLIYQEAVCGLENTSYNSDGFDAYLLSINTYADAITEGFLGDANSLVNQDPYFTSLGTPFETSALFEARTSIMSEALNTNFDDSGNPLLSYIYQLTVCNSITTCPQVGSIPAILTTVSNLNQQEQNRFWNAYKANYLSLKQRLQSGFMNLYAKSIGDYNGCIGLSEAPSLVAPFAGYVGVVAIESYLSGLGAVEDLCDYEYHNLYLSKTKRFIPADYYHNEGANPEAIYNAFSQSADYEYYVATGICPLARDLQLFLDYHFRYLNEANGTVVGNVPYDGQYLTVSLYQELGGIHPTNNTVNINGSVEGDNLTFSWGDGEIVLQLPTGQWGNYGTNWRIIEMSQLYSTYNEVTNTFEFSVLAEVNRMGVVEEIVFSGTTTARIASCSTHNASTVGEYIGEGAGNFQETGSCNREVYFSKALVALLNGLQESGSLNSLNQVDITGLPAFIDSYLSEYYQNVLQVKWQMVLGGTYHLTVNGHLGLMLQVGSSLPTDVTFTAADINLVFNAEETVVMGQSIELAWLNSNLEIESVQGSIKENPDRVLNFDCCGDINAYYNPSINPFCINKTCEEILAEILNFSHAEHEFKASTYWVESGTKFFQTCIDDYYGITAQDAVESMYTAGGQGPVFTVLLNGNPIVKLPLHTGLETLSIQNVVSVELSQPNLPVSSLYDVHIEYLDLQGNLKTIDYYKAEFVCDPSGLNPSYDVGITQVMEDCNESNLPCIPQVVEPVSCTDKYSLYKTTLNSIDDPYGEIELLSDSTFCESYFAYLMDDYVYYLQVMLTTMSVDDPHYISLPAFSATEFGYGYHGMTAVINAYREHVQATPLEDVQTWSVFTSEHLVNLESQGCVSLPNPFPVQLDHIEFPEPEDPCAEMATSIYTAYSADAYGLYLDDIRADFVRTYLQRAIGEVVENFEMIYFDKEYQYTLYYYDQAGNLTQTVPPEGVDRYSENELETVDGSGESLNSRINTYRMDNVALENQSLLPDHELITKYKYNSLNQLVWQSTPDGGITRFAYDELGRIIASQNAKQLQENAFSYTNYDGLGRVVEGGEFSPSTPLSINESTGKLTYTSTQQAVSTINGQYPANVAAQRREVTRTAYTQMPSYSTVLFNTITTLDEVSKANSRNRVTAVRYYETYDEATPEHLYANALYYNYDIHGNVSEFVQHNRLLDETYQTPFSGIKRVEYEYDLISGNVEQVTYQKGFQDQFIHRYTYDADNRIVAVKTSADGYLWEEDANYAYFPHGPLARTELGEKAVQGIDYAYTIQGWLKGVNSDELEHKFDMGEDGTGTHDVARDAFGFTLDFYREDYVPIGTINAFVNSAQGPQNTRELYNGNIKQMTTALLDLDEKALTAQLNHYGYDQLNRIKSMQATGMQHGSVQGTEHGSTYSYDRNGNLLNLNRNALDQNGNQVGMDRLSYFYENGTNQLLHVKDEAGEVGLNDLGSQQDGNYKYDEIGQLESDVAAKIDKISWRVDGKVKAIYKTDGAVLKFHYDGLGNRVGKTRLPENITTVYSRDAQGNVLAVYETNKTEPTTGKKIWLAEHHLYGSARLGMEQKHQLMPQGGGVAIADSTLASNVGDKSYELSNHLGNVLAVISDHKIYEEGSFSADVIAFNDYYPFGMLLPNRHGSAGSYRYGFQGQEKDDEVKGDGNSLNYKYRMHDPRVGRFFAVDPLTAKYPHYSPYSFSGNKVIHAFELEGLEEVEINSTETKGDEYYTNIGNSLSNVDRNQNLTWEGEDGKIYTQVTSNTLVVRDGYADPQGEYKFIYPSGGVGLFGEDAADGLNYYRCAGCHAYNGGYRYAAYNSHEVFMANGISLTVELITSATSISFPILRIGRSSFSSGFLKINRRFWKSSIKFRGTKVYQRNDIFDPKKISSWTEGGQKVVGNNIQRMKSGRAPIGKDGNPVNLHHSVQTNDSPLYEMTQTFHTKNNRVIHINNNKIPTGIDRSEFRHFREAYWINRAKDF